jgi:hypothetical protein
LCDAKLFNVPLSTAEVQSMFSLGLAGEQFGESLAFVE